MESWADVLSRVNVAFADNALRERPSSKARCAECLTTFPEYDNNGAATEESG